MKISPLSSTGMTVGSISSGEPQQSMAQKVRSLKMSTNKTPSTVATEEPPLAAIDAPVLTNPDAKVEDAVAANEETQPLSPQLAALARQRRALQVKERELADREKALQERSDTPSDAIPLAKLKSNALGTLLESGISYEQLTQEVIDQQNGHDPKVAALEEKLRALEEGLNKKLTDRDTQARQQALAEMRREAQNLTQGDDFELVRETGSVPDVMKLIERTYDETGEVLDVREAMSLVEDELIKDSLKLANLKKVQSKLAPQASALQPPPNQQRQMRTLTNRDTASVPMDSRTRALLAFHGQLKK